MNFVYMFELFIVLLGSVTTRNLNDDEYYRLPELFHLDNYEECLVHSEGLYCLGVFDVIPPREPNDLYNIMKEYSEEIYTFNRTQLHRGYCVSSRCPEANATSNFTTNSTQRFANCGAKYAVNLPLQAKLSTFHYCHTRADLQAEVPNTGQLIFLVVISIIVMMNIVGTLYDFRERENPKQIPLLIAWSAIANLKLLTSTDRSISTSLAGLHGIRVCIAVGTCIAHAVLIYYTMYLNNPRVLENIVRHPLSMFIQNSTAMEQMFIVISAFLYAYQLRQFSAKQPVSYKAMPLFIAKRIFRLLPVCLLTVGFAATWWPAISSGPVWEASVGAESKVCRDKFWSHVFFVNNLVKPEKLCVLPTWYMAVDVQMHIMATLVMVLLLLLPAGGLPILVALFALSSLLNASLAYVFDWVPMLYLTISSKNLQTLFRDVPSFAGLYISPWGSMPACFLGLTLGYLYYGMKDQRFHIGKYRWLLIISCVVSFPLLLGWILLGYFIQHVKGKVFMVIYAAMERSIFQILVLLSYIVLCVVCGFLVKFLAWRGWHAMSRLSLPVMMVHWLVNMYLVGSTPQTLSTSIIDIGVHGVATTVYTFLLAIPITILVEMPIKKSFDLLAG